MKARQVRGRLPPCSTEVGVWTAGRGGVEAASGTALRMRVDPVL